MSRHPRKIDCAALEALEHVGAWTRIQGLEKLLPYPVRVPFERLYHVAASGSLDQPREERKHGVQGSVVAAWDVFRYDEKDAPYVINKDHYFVLRDEKGDCWLYGPYGKGDRDHWLKDVPPEFGDCLVLTGNLPVA